MEYYLVSILTSTHTQKKREKKNPLHNLYNLLCLVKLTSETYVEVLLYKNCTLILCQALPGLFSFSQYFNNYLQLRLYVKQDCILNKEC